MVTSPAHDATSVQRLCKPCPFASGFGRFADRNELRQLSSFLATAYIDVASYLYQSAASSARHGAFLGRLGFAKWRLCSATACHADNQTLVTTTVQMPPLNALATHNIAVGACCCVLIGAVRSCCAFRFADLAGKDR